MKTFEKQKHSLMFQNFKCMILSKFQEKLMFQDVLMEEIPTFATFQGTRQKFFRWDPEVLQADEEQQRKSGKLRSCEEHLGVEPKIGGFNHQNGG